MATAPNNDTEPKGFSGLSSLVSDISKDIANANQCPNCGYVSEDCGQECQECGIIFAKYKASVVARTPPQTHQKSTTNSSKITTSSQEKEKDLEAWADDLIAETLGKDASVDKKAKKQNSRKTSSGISPPTDPGNKIRLKWLVSIGCVIAVLWFMSQPDMIIKLLGPSTPPKSTSISSIAARPIEDKPPVGRNHILSYAQIRYCLSEKIRLDAMESLINNYSDTEVDRFNWCVNDYNSRCGEFRYRQGSLQSVHKKVEAERWSIENEGRQRVAAWRGTSKQSRVKGKYPPKPDKLVLGIQKRLTELGYKPGPADGLLGRKTAEAIKAFQRNKRIFVDGKTSKELLIKLDNVTFPSKHEETSPAAETSRR